MSFFTIIGTIEIGLIFAIVALGIFISFRILDFPDLTVDGSFPLGAGVSAVMIVSGINPFVATFISILAGAIAGMITAWLNIRLQILNLLASILVMIALYSVNLRIMGQPNISLLGEETVITPFINDWIPEYIVTPIFFAVIVAVVIILLWRFLHSQLGLAIRATGSNVAMARSQGVNTNLTTIIGMGISNALVAFSGSLYAQSQGSADVTMGIGVIIVGLASVIVGSAIVSPATIFRALIACILGSVLYRFAIAFALNADFAWLKAQDLNLITSVLVILALVLPRLQKNIKKKSIG